MARRKGLTNAQAQEFGYEVTNFVVNHIHSRAMVGSIIGTLLHFWCEKHNVNPVELAEDITEALKDAYENRDAWEELDF